MENNKFFNEIKGRFGFGCMRLPMTDGKVNYAEFCEMTDAFIEAGFNYFDTAHGYIGGQSETAIRDCVAARYPREKFLLANKLSEGFFEKEADIRPFIESQLKLCGVDYFDFYLMHAQSADNYGKYKSCHAYEIASELKNEGKIRHVGLSFHDKASVLDMILTEHPEVEFVQIQLNYIDYNDSAVQSKKCYDVCVKHGKPAVIMEPVKGGSLVNLPDDAKAVFDSLDSSLSYASYAIRFAAGFDNVMTVLSGMSSIEQMRDNLSFMTDFKPLDEAETKAVNEVCSVYKKMNMIPCTACRYCTDGCPMQIDIPNLFSCYNAKTIFNDWNQDYYYNDIYTVNGGKASDCIECGACEQSCPQHLGIRELLKKVADQFES